MNNMLNKELGYEELDIAMNNGYHILIGDITIDDLIDGKKEHVFLSFDPDEIKTEEGWALTINRMIEYFIEVEEYEKCAELKKII
jgi:hypothetical protein|tara:strand:- start:4123 stop:4377 length:255 start_codon:yes stop_codon:yes gene_type:complete